MLFSTLKSVARFVLCAAGSVSAFYLALQIEAVATWPTAFFFLLGGLHGAAALWPIIAYRGVLDQIPRWLDLLILRIGTVLTAAAAITYYSASWLPVVEDHLFFAGFLVLPVSIVLAGWALWWMWGFEARFRAQNRLSQQH